VKPRLNSVLCLGASFLQPQSHLRRVLGDKLPFLRSLMHCVQMRSEAGATKRVGMRLLEMVHLIGRHRNPLRWLVLLTRLPSITLPVVVKHETRGTTRLE